MARSTSIPAAPQSPRTNSDWCTFLLSAFINGLKAYGAALMVCTPATPSESQPPLAQPKPAIQQHAVVVSKPHLALPRTIAKPAWSRA